jgi:hypothetical protein
LLAYSSVYGTITLLSWCSLQLQIMSQQPRPG